MKVLLVNRWSDLRFKALPILDGVAFLLKKHVHSLVMFLDPGLLLNKQMAAGFQSETRLDLNLI